MTNLFRITASSDGAYQHYINTIERGFSIDSVKHFLDEKQLDVLKSIYGDNLIRAWGAMPGTNNAKTWAKMKIGDPVLIYRKGNFEYYAFVAFKLHYPELAKHLWGTDQKGITWEYIYFLNNLVEISVPAGIFNELMGYSRYFHPYGFSSTEAEKLSTLEKEFGSVESFLNYLSEGKWVEKEKSYPQEIKKEIIQERLSRQIGKTSILEANLENILVNDVEKIEPGLRLIGRQVDTKVVGRLDLLCEDREENMVVVELKRGSAGSSIIDQIQRYMGWAIANKARQDQKVRGIIIVATKDTALEYAVKANPLVQVKTFTLSIE